MEYNSQVPGFKIIEHPADTGIVFNAANVESLFEIAAAGMFSIICDTESVGQGLRKTVKIKQGPKLGLDDLLISWLEKLLYIHETVGMLFSKFEIKRLNAGQGISVLDADIYGEKIDLEKHKVYISIKAPTYHKLKVYYDASGKYWSGQVIFDV